MFQLNIRVQFQDSSLTPADKGIDVVSVELVAWHVLVLLFLKGGAVRIALQLEEIQGALLEADAAEQELPELKMFSIRHNRPGVQRDRSTVGRKWKSN